MNIKQKNRDQMYVLEPDMEQHEEGIFYEIIGLRRINEKVEIGLFETRYYNYVKASQSLQALIKTNLLHAGTIRTYYLDGSIKLLGAFVTEKEVGRQIVGDLLGYIVGERTLGTFETENLFLSRQSGEAIRTNRFNQEK